MARINVDDTIKNDIRFTDLISLCGNDYEKALGALVRAWMIGQFYWAKDESLIPKEVWKIQRLSKLLLDCGLVEEKEYGYYCRGSRERFSWLVSSVQSGQKGGIKSGESRRSKINNLERSELKGSEGNSRVSNPPSLSPSLSPSQTLVLPLSQEGDTTAKAVPSPKLIEIWNENCGPLAKVKSANSKRLRLIATRWRELDELQWVEVVQRLSRSNFCTGQNDRGWRADFDFLLKADTATKTLEGRYDNREGLKNGMTEDGRYLTPAMKRSHNNLTMFKKLNEGDKNDEPAERDVKASLPNG